MGRLGHKKGALDYIGDWGRLATKTGGGMATAGGVMSLTGVGAPAGAGIAGAGALVGALGGVASGVSEVGKAIEHSDFERGLEGLGTGISGALGIKW